MLDYSLLNYITIDELLQEKKIAYRAIEVKDAVKVAPLMNLIDDAIKLAEKDRKGVTKDEEPYYFFEITVLCEVVRIELDKKSMLALRDTLTQIGFCTSR